MRKFWIDTDTASDDAVAILMALRWPDVHVEGISVVAGNVPVEMGGRNARYTVELCGRQTPVYLGLPRPLLREPSWAYFFHGPDGMGGMNYLEAKRPAENKHGVDALIEAVQAAPGEITLVTLGPLSNIATALRVAPDIAEKIPMCYIMGGAAACLGNVTPAAEFNIWVDPEAARMVFKSGMPILMVGWEHCRGAANLDDADMAHVRGFKTKYADFAIDCNAHAIKTNAAHHREGNPREDAERIPDVAVGGVDQPEDQQQREHQLAADAAREKHDDLPVARAPDRAARRLLPSPMPECGAKV